MDTAGYVNVKTIRHIVFIHNVLYYLLSYRLIMAFCPFTGRDITHVNVEVVPCTKVSVDIFDPIYSNGILRPSGHIVKCYHEVIPDFDELRMVWIILSINLPLMLSNISEFYI